MTARCARSIGDVDKSRPGLFLFNYFVAEDPEVALERWEHLAGWYAPETGLDNSTVLQPTGEADYAFVNHARWEAPAGSRSGPPCPGRSANAVLRRPEVSGQGSKQGSRHVNGAWRFSTGRAPMASRREHGRQFAAG
ncbi:hypothetical protein [Actinacidiphila oryziradicis]|uniref:Uncharacterized protein n=1 Tax=Actinacidiphila oryziradicis TaxID=2571141 RepID=A0A4V5MXZ4_9ACTN|nr:hypothetical protein [Actinacidiphila oryziradicis]TKA01939.1 hypothetical protein FCI23_39820 [Actinacidiphila oryziradicis]